MENKKTEINKELLMELSTKADHLILNGDLSALKKFTHELVGDDFHFNEAMNEANFLYIIGNCYQFLYQHRELEWYSDNLSKAVIFFRRALNIAESSPPFTKENIYLKSCIETNLANSLSAQGRAFCCIPLWDKAIAQNNPIAIICKARNELYLSSVLYDPGHQEYHLFVAYKLILEGLKYKSQLYEEQQAAFHKDGELMKFKSWFEDNFSESSFDEYENESHDFDSRKQRDYLKWCGHKKLFINDLNDVLCSEIVYQDIITLPGFKYKLNQSLSMHETLMYHGNFDELKNEYCYARYLFFTAASIPQETNHIFNNTYPHVDDMSHSITNLKSSHYKSAFRILYSLFDKISYFLHRFLELNDIKDDWKINFDAIFRDISNKEAWIPHPRLKISKNPFIHALFYILKDIRDVKDATPTTRWLDPEAKSFAHIRNALEHRSLKIIDDFGYTLMHSDKYRTSMHLETYKSEKKQCEKDLMNVMRKIKKGGNANNMKEMIEQKKSLEINIERLKSVIAEQGRLSTHSLLVKVTEFESRTLTLMKLARNAIMYLSLALHAEEQNKPQTEGFFMPTEVPLR